MSTVTDETKPKTRALTLRDRLQSPAQVAELSRAMPAHCKPDRMIRVALTALTRTKHLEECTPQSFFLCMLNLSQWGLEPDGRRAHLIPYKNGGLSRKAGHDVYECTLVIDYKGYVELAYRSGRVNAIHADVVRRGDLFRYSAGYIVEHVPWFLRDPDDRPEKEGDIYAVYCIVQMKDMAAKHEVMSVVDVERIKERSSGWQAFKKGYTKETPWNSDWSEMAKKTCFRRTQKWLPLSAEIADAMDAEDTKFDPLVPAPSRGKEVAGIEDLTRMLAGPTDGNGNGDHHESHDDGETNSHEGEQGAVEPKAEEKAPEKTIQPDSPRDAVDPLVALRAKLEAEFFPGGVPLPKGEAKKRYDAYCGPEGTLSDEAAALCSEIYERCTAPKGELFTKGQKSATEAGH